MRPYQSVYITFIEGYLTGLLCMIAWCGAMADLMFKNKNYSKKFVTQVYYVDWMLVFL